MTVHTAHKLTKANRQRLAHLIILGIWALVQYFLGNKIYGLFIIIFFFILMLSRSPNFILVAIPVLVIVLFNTSAIDTAAQLKQWNLNTVQNYKRTLSNIFSPNSGQDVLPNQVQRMLALIQQHHIASYKLSRTLRSDPLIRERIKESAWPLKMEGASHFLLGLTEEIKADPTCMIIDQNEDVVLAYCP